MAAHRQQQQPQAELGGAEQEQVEHVARVERERVANGQTTRGHSSADRQAAGSMGVCCGE